MSKIQAAFANPVGGVALVPIHCYYNPGHHLHGKVCVVLAREIAGSYAGKLNFIGGSAKEHGMNGWQTLCYESEEELGLPMSAPMLEKSILGHVRYSGSLVIGAHITGLSARKWAAMQMKRRGLSHKFNELTEIVHVPVDQLYSMYDLSDYVIKFRDHVIKMAAKLRRDNAVHYTLFTRTTTPINRGVAMLE